MPGEEDAVFFFLTDASGSGAGGCSLGADLLSLADSAWLDELVRLDSAGSASPAEDEGSGFSRAHSRQLFSFKNDLLSAADRASLVGALWDGLSALGVGVWALVLYEDGQCSEYAGGYAEGEPRGGGVRFLREAFVPERYAGDFARGCFAVLPLCGAGSAFGYLVCAADSLRGLLLPDYSGDSALLPFDYEEIRLAVSAALRSVFLSERAEAAERGVAQAELARKEFFANVGSDLCDPLKDIAAKLQQMESNVDRGMLDREILSEQLLFVRSQIDSQLGKMETLVNLTRSQVDGLPMDKKLFDIRQVLPGSAAAALDRDFPLLYGDSERLKRAIQAFSDYSEKIPFVSEKLDGIHIEFYASRFDWQKPELLLAGRIIALQQGVVAQSENYAEIVLPWPSLSGQSADMPDIGSARSFSLSEGAALPYLFAEGVSLHGLSDVVLFWEPDSAPIDEWVKVYSLRHNESLFRAPLVCRSRSLIGHTFSEMIEQKVRARRAAPVLFVNASRTHYGEWATDSNSVSIPSMQEFDKILGEITPALVVFEFADEEGIGLVRQNPKTALVPILVLPDTMDSDADVEKLCPWERVLLCNQGAAVSEKFEERVKRILAGGDILPPHTGALVKKAILYLNKNAASQIVRWKLADEVHVSEDYLTRIFHKEIGLSLWDYLNRYRIHLATKLLRSTEMTISDIAERTGFQDQAYFCRVFKKIYGVPPGKMRSK